MLDLNNESDRIDSRFLEPTCGSGNFLIPVLERKLLIAELESRGNKKKRDHLSLLALMSIYGIELLKDNVKECRLNLLEAFSSFLELDGSSDLYQAAHNVLTLNIIQGNTLEMRTNTNRPIIFSEWTYNGKGKFKRKDFRFDSLVNENSNGSPHTPLKVYSPMSIRDIAKNTTKRSRELTL